MTVAAAMSREEKRAVLVGMVAWYVPLLHLEHWTIRTSFFNTREEMPAEDACAAGCNALSEYRRADLTFTLDEMDPEEMEADVLHELVHNLNWQLFHIAEWTAKTYDPNNEVLKEWCRYMLEDSTTGIERILWDHLPRFPRAGGSAP